VKLVLFDIDGTLMRGHGVGTRAMQRAGRALCGELFDLEGIVIGGGLDPLIFAAAARKLGILEPGPIHDAFRELYLQELQRELDSAARRPELLPGVTALLAALATRDDVMVGLVTGNYQRAVPLKFAAVGLGIASFVVGAYGDCGPSRPELVRIALARARARAASLASSAGRRFEIDPARTIVVGDTPRDVHCALENGCMCLAVTTGEHDRAQLTQAGAQHVAAGLSDPSVLLDLLV
jgi:phosphoglycolate phosphatase